MSEASISVLVPAYNEENRIGNTIKALKQILIVKQIIVIDDGSKDNTAAIAQQEGAQVIRLAINQGKGKALNIGAAHIRGEFIALIDADLENTALEIKRLIEPVISGKVDMSIAVFPPTFKKGGVGLVKKTAALGLRILTDKDFHAPLSGQRVMTRKLFEDLLPFASGFGVEVGMTIDACLKGYKIIEIPTSMGHNETGRNLAGFLHRGAQLKDVFFTLTMKGWRKWGFY